MKGKKNSNRTEQSKTNNEIIILTSIFSLNLVYKDLCVVNKNKKPDFHFVVSELMQPYFFWAVFFSDPLLCLEVSSEYLPNLWGSEDNLVVHGKSILGTASPA